MATRMKSTNSSWSGNWAEAANAFISNAGHESSLKLIGKVVDLRFHSVTSSVDITRYIAAVIDVSQSYKRRFDEYGTEQQPTTEEYLSHDNLCKLLGHGSCGPAPAKVFDSSILKALHPHSAGRFELWGEAQMMQNSHLEVGAEVWATTQGHTMIVERIYPTQMSSFHGMEGGNVMEAMSGRADSKETGKLAQDSMEGCDDDEWD